MYLNFFLTNIFNFVKIGRKEIKKAKINYIKKEMEGPESLSHHLCYNNIIVFGICQSKKKAAKPKKCDKWKFQNKIEMKQSKEKHDRLVSFICFFNFLKK